MNALVPPKLVLDTAYAQQLQSTHIHAFNEETQPHLLANFDGTTLSKVVVSESSGEKSKAFLEEAA